MLAAGSFLFSWQQWQPNQALRSGCLLSCQADGHKQTAIQTARVQRPKPQATVTGGPEELTPWECPMCPRGHCTEALAPGLSGAVYSADSTVTSCCWPCISIIFGEATLFSIILISVSSATLLSCLCLSGQSIKYSSHKH